ncbi:MAG: RNA polymerase sigma factor [Bacteroidota bacterium]
MTQSEFLSEINTLENLLFAFALRLTRSHQDAQDLMQETTMRAFRHRAKFTKGTNFKSWVSTIMRNTFINRYRKLKSRKHINQPVEDFTYALESTNTIPNEGEHNLRMNELQNILNSISDIYRIPFAMFYKGYEYKEIAEYLDIPIGTVKSRIFLARKKMKTMIKGQKAAA